MNQIAFDKIHEASAVSMLSLDDMERLVNEALAGEFDEELKTLRYIFRDR